MCGILGFVDKNGRLDEGEKSALLTRMLERIAHRGKDSHGTFIDGKVALAHARLSIIDLSPLGHQPMKNAREDLFLSYNGEIYNHLDVRGLLPSQYSFRSHSDTETLLCGYEEWGQSVLAHLKGMFAFSVYDRTKQDIFFAVDRFSIKPLYYIDTPDWFAWSSEAKSLLLLPGVSSELNREALSEHLLFRSLAGRETLFRGIYKMLPSETLRFDLETLEYTQDRYWHLPNENFSFKWSDHAATIRNLLEESVAAHMLADVPVGVQLSGGVDSSLVAALVRKNIPKGQELHSFSIGLNEKEWNEFPYSRQVSALLGTIHHELVFTEEDYCAMLPIATYHYDEPINHSHSVPMLMLAEEAAKYVKVLMSGEGSDEIFGGYRRYEKLLKAGVTDGNILESSMFEQRADVSTLLGETSIHHFAHRDQIIGEVAEKSELFRVGWYDLNTYLTPLLLRQDKMGMRSTLENRVPFLDHDLVKAAFALGDNEKICAGEAKVTLKKVASEYLPSEIVYRVKVGFSQPIAVWLRNDELFGRYLTMIIRANERRQLFDQQAIERLAREHRAEEKDNAAILWTLINLEIWMKIFIDGEPPEKIWNAVRE